MRDGIGYLANPVHQPPDAVEHVVDDFGNLVKLVATAGQTHTFGEVAGSNRSGGCRDVGQGPAKQVADEKRPDARHQQHDNHGPQQRVGQQSTQLRPHLHVTTDQQVVAAGEVKSVDCRH